MIQGKDYAKLLSGKYAPNEAIGLDGKKKDHKVQLVVSWVDPNDDDAVVKEQQIADWKAQFLSDQSVMMNCELIEVSQNGETIA